MSSSTLQNIISKEYISLVLESQGVFLFLNPLALQFLQSEMVKGTKYSFFFPF